LTHRVSDLAFEVGSQAGTALALCLAKADSTASTKEAHMKFNRSITFIAVALVAVASLTLPAPAEAQQQRRASAQVGANCVGGFQALFDEIEPVPLFDDEVTEIAFLLEEEKLARDVYRKLAERWRLPIFRNIAEAEQRHMDLVQKTFEIYGLDLPVTFDTGGVFDDPILAGVYEQLVFEGGFENDAATLIDALGVGVEIEDMDLLDLYDFLEITQNDLLELVIHNLSKGSRNHLRAFMRALEAQGGSYTPGEYLDEETFNSILEADMEQRIFFTADGEPVPACGAAVGGFGMRRGRGLQNGGQEDGQGNNGESGSNGNGTGECDGTGPHGGNGTNGNGTGTCDGTGSQGGGNGGNSSGNGGSS
jgi:hypothetical protein